MVDLINITDIGYRRIDINLVVLCACTINFPADCDHVCS